MKKLILSTLLVLLVTPAAFALKVGDAAPTIVAKNQNGKDVNFSDFKGKYVLVYFYPKDETPGCTKEACSLRDAYAKIKAMNTVVYGVSRQDAKSHKEFIAHHHLPFDLIVDTDGKVGNAFGVGSIALIGLSKRESILIGPDGKVLQVYPDVDPSKHTEEILTEIAKSKKG